MELTVIDRNGTTKTRVKLTKKENEVIKNDIPIYLKAFNGKFEKETARYFYYIFDGDLINIKKGKKENDEKEKI